MHFQMREVAGKNTNCSAAVFGSREFYRQCYKHRVSLEWQERARSFDNASAVLVTSRAEPLDMVILEAMLHYVPAFFTNAAGTCEIINFGIQIDPNYIEHSPQQVNSYLSN